MEDSFPLYLCGLNNLVSSSAVLHQLLNSLIEIFRGEELFDGEMHAVAPVMTWVGRNVDALGVSVWQTELLVDRQPVLKRQEA